MTKQSRLVPAARLGALLPLFSAVAMGGPAPAPITTTPDLAVPLCDGRLLGDLMGLRTPADTGIDFRVEATNFYHGVLEGDDGFFDDSDDLEFGGKVDLFFDLDGHKAGLWPGFFVKVHGEFRYGDASGQAGALSPVNTAMISPTNNGEAFAFTNVTVTQALSESFLITLGKFNMIDMADKRFYGGRGTEGFMNTSLVAMPIAGRTMPISTLGAVATWLKDGAPFIDVGIVDSVSPTTAPGWNGLSADELTVFADITLRTDLNGLLGTHTIMGSYSTLDATSLDQSDFLRPPSEGGLVADETDDSWQLNYLWEQSITQMGDDPSRGWGTFVLLGLSDGDPNPFEYSIAAGLVANGVCAARPCDSFGLGLFYNGVSDDLKDTLESTPAAIPSIDLQNEFGGEIFYDFAITEWLRISADLQVVQPVLEDNDLAIFGGLRSRVIF